MNPGVVEIFPFAEQVLPIFSWPSRLARFEQQFMKQKLHKTRCVVLLMVFFFLPGSAYSVEVDQKAHGNNAPSTSWG